MPPPMLVAGLFLLVCLVGADSGPVWPIPSDLWKPPSGSTPPKGNFVYLNSQPGDCVGGGKIFTYTPLNATLSFTQTVSLLKVSIQGDEDWNGDFEAMSSLSELERGYYGGMEPYPFNNASVGGLSWDGNGCGCNTLTGWFAVDEVTYKGGNLTFISLRFEQHCEGANPALRGALRWDINDHRTPNGPTKPPKGLWTPPKTAISSGNYLYLESQPGDWVGGGQNYSYTLSNALISASTNASHLFVTIKGNRQWNGDFQGMSSIKQLVKGYYGNLQLYPGNPALGGLSWDGYCDTLSGWFMVDEITYNATGLVSVQLRFAQHCEEATPALYGALNWSANNPVNPPGPVNPPPPGLWEPASVPDSGNYVYLESDPGDNVGGGQNYTYTSNDTDFTFTTSGNLLNVEVIVNDNWSGQFEGMMGLNQLEQGYYGGLMLYPYNNPVFGGLSWCENWCSCNSASGWFVIDQITYFSNGTLSAIKLRFAQYCETRSSALHGVLIWAASNPIHPSGPVNPPPEGLWAPPKAIVSSGNYVYLESQQGDWVGGGQNYSYNSSNALISISSNTSQLSVSINGNERWGGRFQGMISIQQLIKGYYGEIQAYPFNNPVLAGLFWGSCYMPMSGWFVVDEIAYNSTGLVSVTLRFAQHCNKATPALFGALSWNANYSSDPSGPVNPPPEGLWTPPKAAVSSGNYVYLESQPGDYVGGGQNYSYTPSDAIISISTNSSQLYVAINGNEQWNGEFQGMSSLHQLLKGYYGELQINPFNNPVLAGLSWGNCYNSMSGWLMVDEIMYNDTGLVSVTLRFAQHCGNANPALYGALSWSTKNPSNPPGPVNPPPKELWTPPKNSVSSGNYVYLESQQGDNVGGGHNYSYNSSNALFSISTNTSQLSVSINGDERWTGIFQGMSSIQQLIKGYYGNLQTNLFNNPVLAGLSWGNCDDSISGWFVVDEIAYNFTGLVSVQLRFAQHCGNAIPALYGALNWSANNPTNPPGPVNPPPPGLWEPASDAVPESGNYVYLESDPGDNVGGGQNYTYTSNDTDFSFTTSSNLLNVEVNGIEEWSGQFKGMMGLNQLEEGYYGGLMLYPDSNTVVGSLSWCGNWCSCNSASGWFVIDQITYFSNGTLSAIKLRFAQYCEEGSSALHGAIVWAASSPINPSGPVNPPPEGLWTPPKTAISSGNYLYLESQQGDYVGGGQNYSYTSSNALISIIYNTNQLSVSIYGNEQWNGEFRGIQQLIKGYYGEIQAYPFNNPVLAGLFWGSCNCNPMSGWFVVDEITYNYSTGLASVTLRFAQHCNEANPALYGALSWNANYSPNPPGPVNPPPKELWTPPKAAISSGNYVYLESQQGDWVGGGQNYSYNSSNALFSIRTNTNQLFVAINGNQQWKGEFHGMSTTRQLVKGYYGEIQPNPFNNPVLAGLSWESYNCNPMTGWFVVDEVTYNATGLVSVALRFAQHCQDTTPALYGALNWSAKNPSSPPGPVNPSPKGLWTPPKAAISSGNYVYLESQQGDWVGGGQNYSYNSSNALFSISTNTNQLFVAINGNQQWKGEFHGMSTTRQLVKGYYGEIQIYPLNNPVLAGLSWGNCYRLNSGWLVVDEITYNATGLVSVTLRFAQHCNAATAALFGALSWSANNPANPPGPASPPPKNLWTPPESATSSGNYLYLESLPGDPIGAGQNYSYISSNAIISVSTNTNQLSVSINGNQQFSGEFSGMSSIRQLAKGYYGEMQPYPFNNPVLAGLSWGSYYGPISGWFVVDEIAYNATGLVSVQLRFAQHCGEANPALYGAFNWSANNPVNLPVPVNPPPPGLWEPASDAVPKSENYVYLESDPGDNVGGGQNYTYTSNDTDFTFTTSGNFLYVGVNGNEEWSGQFEGMMGLNQLEQGYYGGLMLYPYNNPVFGGLSWCENWCSCNSASGWFVIDQITYFSNGTLSAIKLRFAQYCETGSSALHGAIVWAANNPINPSGPVNPPPEGLWTPPEGLISSGNYVYLESHQVDNGRRTNYSCTSSNAIISISTTENQLSVSIIGNEQWNGVFQGMSSIVQLVKGYYGEIQAYPFNNPVLAGLSWGNSPCNPMSGWFVIDEITYNSTGLVSVTLRFAQHCNEATPALYGALSWSAKNPTKSPNPVKPPKGLWAPAKNSVPQAGNYVYLESEPGDYIGGGQNYTYTPNNSTLSLNNSNNNLYAQVTSNDGDWWSGNFEGMQGLTDLEVGYYGGLHRYPVNNHVLGGLSWSGNGSGCGTLTGWFVVDAIAFASGEMSEVKLRFEQHCEGEIPALHGVISWKTSTSLF